MGSQFINTDQPANEYPGQSSWFRGFYNSEWYNYILCLLATVFMALGEGSYLFQIVPYLEMRNAGSFDIGVTNGILSAVEALACLVIGFLYKNRHTKLYLLIGILSIQASAIILSFQPLGLIVKLASALNGLGIGIALVLVHSTLLANRPQKISLGLTVGIYTAAIAAGNAIGAFLSGLIVDSFGFTAGFIYCLFAFLVFMLIVIALQMSRSRHHAEVIPDEKTGRSRSNIRMHRHRDWIWQVSLLAGFTMACVVIVSEVIFPIYALRSGLSISFLGTLHGIKMMLAAVVRPLSGLLLVFINSASLTILSLGILTLSVAFLPFVGLSWGLILLSSLIGITFGTCRVTSATLSVENVKTNAENSRRIGLYSFALSFGQIITPVIGGWTADSISLTHTIAGLPVIFLILFGIGFYYLWRKNTKKVKCSSAQI